MPEDSNLTITGQLLEGLRTKFIISKFVIVIDAIKSKHKRYKTRTNRGKAPTASIRDIFEYQSKLGRDIGLIFNRSAFTNKISKALQSAIKTFYRN